MKRVLAAVAACAMCAAGQAHGGALAPAPQIIADYDARFPMARRCPFNRVVRTANTVAR